LKTPAPVSEKEMSNVRDEEKSKDLGIQDGFIPCKSMTEVKNESLK
jgi:hypothetical protein